MRRVLALVLFLSGAVSSNAASLLERRQVAQREVSAECVANCNSTNYTCAMSCGLSGACVAQCTAEAAACKSRCGERK
ncbi:hypothetical protein SAMN05444050_1262 [Afipia sp. GAS231]|nr:hypothetical protein SAMN05444050_1262 [Afipia sp. GAS231]